ncbi:hypothetical protein PQR15_08190 [Streptomyces lydicus]|nr:hypothetical protein [Streptomyces lydicus]
MPARTDPRLRVAQLLVRPVHHAEGNAKGAMARGLPCGHATARVGRDPGQQVVQARRLVERGSQTCRAGGPASTSRSTITSSRLSPPSPRPVGPVSCSASAPSAVADGGAWCVGSGSGAEAGASSSRNGTTSQATLAARTLGVDATGGR